MDFEINDIELKFPNFKNHRKKILSLNRFNIDKDIAFDEFNYIISLVSLNKINRIQSFFLRINRGPKKNGDFLFAFETIKQRNKRKKIRNIFIIGFFFRITDYLVKRFLSKFFNYSSLSKSIIKTDYKVYSKAEILGRISYNNFKIIQVIDTDNFTYVHCSKQKILENFKDTKNRIIFKSPRIGQFGNIIYVYKFRTMYLYSEYIQDYIYKSNGSKDGDKINNDYRVSTIGSFLRKLWIDEIPMLINLLKGELKIFGVRPLTKTKFDLYPKYAQNLRIKYKPGLIPPFYVDLPDDFKSLVHSEVKYLKEYESKPILTDFKYFFKAIYNIIIKGKRSN